MRENRRTEKVNLCRNRDVLETNRNAHTIPSGIELRQLLMNDSIIEFLREVQRHYSVYFLDVWCFQTLWETVHLHKIRERERGLAWREIPISRKWVLIAEYFFCLKIY